MTPQDPLPAGDPFFSMHGAMRRRDVSIFQCPWQTDFGESYEQDL
jgi:hypothetical protein